MNLASIKKHVRPAFISLLASGILFSSSCAAPVSTPAPGGDAEATTLDAAAPAASTEDPALNDDLGEFDFKGVEWRVFTRSVDWENASVDYPEAVGEVYHDAIYNRNRKLEERFNFKIVQSQGTDMAPVKKTLLAGENAYDLIITRCPDTYVWAQDGLIHPFSALTHVNLDKPYWDKYMNRELTISNKRYFAVSDFNVPAYDFIHVLVFNKKLVQDFNLTSPYQAVLDGSWTQETFEQMTKNVTKDIDGDSKMTAADTYGFLSNPKQVLPCFWVGAGQKSIIKDANDLPVNNMSDPKFVDVFQKIYTFTWDTNAWYQNKNGDNLNPEFMKMFQNNQALFMDCTFFYIAQLREMTADFGILPFPKLDENQKEYYSRMEGCDLMCVPSWASQEACDRTSVILEAMSSESAKSVIPAYYEIALKTKFTRDPESMQMLDIIFKNRVFDFGDTIWCGEVRDGVISTMFQTNNRDIISKYASLEKVVAKLIDKNVTSFQKLA